jgi:hypothetical protein
MGRDANPRSEIAGHQHNKKGEILSDLSLFYKNV